MSSMWVLLVCMAVCLPTGLANSRKNPVTRCSDIRAMPGFNLDKFMGQWYVRGTSGSNIPNRCTREKFTLIDDKSAIDIYIEYLANKGEKDYTSLCGSAVQTNARKHEGRWDKTVQKSDGEEETSYIILATDYNTFAIALSCSDKTSPQLRVGFILTRAEDLDSSNSKYNTIVKRDISKALGTLKLNERVFTLIDHKNCPK